jgi:hypothetical protein
MLPSCGVNPFRSASQTQCFAIGAREQVPALGLAVRVQHVEVLTDTDLTTEALGQDLAVFAHCDTRGDADVEVETGHFFRSRERHFRSDVFLDLGERRIQRAAADRSAATAVSAPEPDQPSSGLVIRRRC